MTGFSPLARMGPKVGVGTGYASRWQMETLACGLFVFRERGGLRSDSESPIADGKWQMADGQRGVRAAKVDLIAAGIEVQGLW